MKITWGESFLDLTLEFLPNDDLLNILKREQLPKLKVLFDMPLAPTMRKKSKAHYMSDSHVTAPFPVESTPKSNLTKQSSNLSESTSSNKSFLKQITQSETYSGRALLSYLVGSNSNNSNVNSSEKLSNQLSFANQSHRGSICSIKSGNSDDNGLNSTQSTNGGGGSGSGGGGVVDCRPKIILDEPVNPKRPLRPNRLQHQNSSNSMTNSTSTSNQNSRPMSHLSGVTDTDLNSIANLLNIQDIHINDEDFIDSYGNHVLPPSSSSSLAQPQPQPPPPPKPPKLVRIKPNLSPAASQAAGTNGTNGHHANGNGHHHSSNGVASVSSEDLNNEMKGPEALAAKSSTSLNSVQFRYLASKTTSDTVLNRVRFWLFFFSIICLLIFFSYFKSYLKIYRIYIIVIFQLQDSCWSLAGLLCVYF